MNDDNKRKLYDALSGDYDMGTFEQFSSDILDTEKRKRLYEAIKGEYDLPDFDGFSQQLGIEPQSAQQQPAQQPDNIMTEDADGNLVPAGQPASAARPAPAPKPTNQEVINRVMQGRQSARPADKPITTPKREKDNTRYDGAGMVAEAVRRRQQAQVPQVRLDVNGGNAGGKYGMKLDTGVDLGLTGEVPQSQAQIQGGEQFADDLGAGAGATVGVRALEEAAKAKEEARQRELMGDEAYEENVRLKKALGDKETTPMTISEVSAQIEDKLANINDEIEKERKKLANNMGVRGALQQNIATRGSVGVPQELLIQRALIENAKKSIEVGLEERDGVDNAYLTPVDIMMGVGRHLGPNNPLTGIGSFIKNAGRKAFDPKTWDFGIHDLVQAQAISDAADAVEAGTATDAQRALLDAASLNMIAEGYKYAQAGHGLKAGETTGEMLPFMVEMFINPIASLGEGAAKKVAQIVSKRFAKSLAKKGLRHALASGAVKLAEGATRFGLSIPQGAGMAVTTSLPATMADYYQRKNGDVQADVEDGQVVYGGRENQKDAGEALFEAIAANTAEHGTEISGSFLTAPAAKLLGWTLGKAGKVVSKGASRFGLGRVMNWMGGYTPSRMTRVLTDIEKQAHWTGTLDEFFEEIDNGILNSLFVGDQRIVGEDGRIIATTDEKGIFNLENLLDTFLGVGAFGMAVSAIKTATYKPAWQNYKFADAEGRKQLGDKWDEYRNGIETASNEELPRTVAGYLEEGGMTEEQAKALIGYAKANVQFDAAMSAVKAKAAEGDPKALLNVAATEAEADGYEKGAPDVPAEEVQDVDNEAELLRQRVVELLGEEVAQQIDNDEDFNALYVGLAQSGNTEGAKVAADYYQAKARRDGMISRVQDDIEAAVEESNDAVLQRTHKDGTIRKAYIQAPDSEGGEQEVYVKNGNIVMLPDGSGIDREKMREANPDGMIVCYDPKTGENRPYSIDDFLRVEAPVDPNEEMAGAAQIIGQRMSQEFADKANGKVPELQAGDVYQFATGNGNVVPVEILEPVEGMPGTYHAIMNGVEYEALPLQEMVDNAAKRRAEKNITIREGIPVDVISGEGTEQGQTPQTPAEGQQPLTEEPAAPQKPAAPTIADVGDTMPMTGEGEDAEPDFSHATPARAHSYIFEESGYPTAVANELVAVKQKEAGQTLMNVRKKEPKFGTKEIGSSMAKYNKAAAQWNADMEAAKAALDYWNQVAELQKAATSAQQEAAPQAAPQVAPQATVAPQQAPVKPTTVSSGAKNSGEKLLKQAQEELKGDRVALEMLQDQTPRTLEELAAQMLYGNKNGTKLMFDDEELDGTRLRGVAAHTGFFRSDVNGFPFLFASRAKGGISIEEFAHQLIEMAQAENAAGNTAIKYDEYDANAGLNAINELLSSVHKQGDINNYILNRRIAEAREYHEEMERQREEYEYEQQLEAENRARNGMTEQEYDANISSLEERLAEQAEFANSQAYFDAVEEYLATFAPDNQQITSTNYDRRSKIESGGGQQEGLGESQGQDADQVSAQAAVQSGTETGARRERAVESEPNFSSSEEIQEEEAKVNTEPTEGQKKAGNYKMGHIKVNGFDVTIENPKGSVRRGVDGNGKAWEQVMNNTYGYIRGTEGVDGDHIDVFLSDDPEDGYVFVIDQVNPETGEFDEHKVMYGFMSGVEAAEAYLSNYEKGWQGLGAITRVDQDVFKEWIKSSRRKTKPFCEYVGYNEDVYTGIGRGITKKESYQVGDKVKFYVDGRLYTGELTDWDGERFTAKGKGSYGRKIETKIWPQNIKERYIPKRRSADEVEVGGALVDQLQDMGVEVTTDLGKNRAAKKQAQNDNSENGKLREMRTSDGNVYGFSYRGKLYLDPRRIDAELPLHEYGHLWCEAFRKLNPEGWQEIVDIIKSNKESWDFVQQLYPETKDENDLAEEVIAHFSGKRGAERLREELARMSERDDSYRSKWNNIFQNISKAIQDFWKKVGDFLNLHYNSAEEVYDQVLKDFVDKVNPRKRVEDWLKERDAAYMAAVNDGDMAKAKDLFDAALRENIGNGITPFLSARGYSDVRKLAHGVKSRDPKIIAEVADMMAPLIPKDAVLVPAPGHSGDATDMLDLARALSERTGAPVADVLKGNERVSQYEAKQAGGVIAAGDMGITMQGELPEGLTPIVIDNVVDTGNTAEACVKALSRGIVVSLGDSADRYRHVASLKSAEPVVTDKKGNVVPLSRRFEITSKYLDKAADKLSFMKGDVQLEGDAQERWEKTAAILTEMEEKYFGREMDAAWKGMNDEELLKVLGLPEEEIAKSSPEEIKTFREWFFSGNRLACYNQLTGNIIIFAENLAPERAEEAFFHENIHAILHKWYGDKARGIAERFWNAAPDKGGKVDKAFIKRNYPEEKWPEEFFVNWLGKAMADGSVDEVYGYLTEEPMDAERLDNILNTIDYDREQETRKEESPDRLVREKYRDRVHGSGRNSEVGYDREQETRGQEAKEPSDRLVRGKLLSVLRGRREVADGEQETREREAQGENVSGESEGNSGRNKAGVQGLTDALQNLSALEGEGRTLMGVHNISEAKLRKAIKQGGLANPSLAVIDTQNGMHSDYGEISLIPTSSLIDAKTGRNAGTFAGDAWTATYPSVDKIMSDEGYDLFFADLREMADLRSELRMAWENHLEGRNPDRLAYWFLNERGIAPEKIYFDSGYPEQQKDLFAKITDYGKKGFTELTEEERNSILSMYAEKEGISLEKLKAKYQLLHEKNEQVINNNEVKDFRKSLLRKLNKEIEEYGISLSVISDFMYGLEKALESDGKLNTNGTLQAAYDKMKSEGLESEFMRWLDEKEQKYGVKEMIFVGYTPDGDRKYVPNTVKNASKIMNEESEANAGDQTGFGATRAVLLKKMYSLDDIRKQKGKLEGVSEETDKLYQEASDEMFGIVKALSDMQVITDNPFSNVDYANARLIEAMGTKDPIGYLNREYGYKISKNGEFAKGLKAMLQTLENLPVKYFETKFKRPVTLDEFAVAVVPEGTSREVLDALEKAGLDIRTYNNTGEDAEEKRREAVMDAVNERDDILFRDDEEESPIFFSNAARAVEGIKQEKATPEQWLAMIEKAGGLKAGEDKWMGLSEWLKGSDKKTLTKQEVLDYIRKNEIQIEDVTYGNALFSPNSKRNLESEIERGRENGESVEDVLRAWDKEFDDRLLEAYRKGEFSVENGVVITDTPLMKPINDTRLNYTTAGLENKREIALVVPTVESWNDDDQIHFGDAGDGRAVAWVRFGETETGFGKSADHQAAKKAMDDYYNSLIEKYGNDDDPLTFASKLTPDESAEMSRLEAEYDRTFNEGSKRVLVIDEIQSKRHQEGRERGYVGQEVRKLNANRQNALEAKAAYAKGLRDKYGDDYLQKEWTKEETDKFNALQSDIDKANEALSAYEEANGYSYNRIPDAPFERTWHELAMKRMLRYAAEHGYDKVAWTTGAQQAERYNIGSAVRSIDAGIDQEGNRVMLIHQNEGGTIDITFDDEGNITSMNKIGREALGDAKNIRDVVGKEIAIEALSVQGRGTENMKTWKGDGLRIGGEGMKGFYDEILPRFMNKYGKKWGVKVGEVELPNVEEAGRRMWAVDVTPEMKESVMQGQPLFRQVTDEDEIERLESEPTMKLYRSMVEIDGKLYPPMSSKEGGTLREPSEIGKWEQSDEAPSRAVLRNGKWVFPLKKDNGKGLYAAYNPYIHSSDTMLNDQFSEAQNRGNLVVVEVEVPVSELTSGYKAEKAKDSVGEKEWKAGPIQGKLSGKRKVVLSRWAKPVRIVPVDEVADNIVKMLDGQVDVMPSNVVTPQLRSALEARGMKFVETDNKGKILDGENKGKTWSSVYGGRVKDSALKQLLREGEGAQMIDAALMQVGGRSSVQISKYQERARKKMRTAVENFAKELRLDVEILDSAANMGSERKRKAKGWYDPKTGKVYIVLGNHGSVQDAIVTLLHEGVAHHGLREMFGEAFDTFLDNVYNNSSLYIKAEISDIAAKMQAKDKKDGKAVRSNEAYRRIATEEYMARLAESTNFENPESQAWWTQVKHFFMEMLAKVAAKLKGWIKNFSASGTSGVTLTDNELRYILWRSYQNLKYPGRYKGVFAEAEDVAMQQRLKVGDFSQAEPASTLPMAAENGAQDDMGSKQQPAANHVITSNGSEFSKEEKDNILDVTNSISSARPDAIGLVKTPSGFVAINKSRKKIADILGVNSDEPYLIIPENKLDIVLPRLIKAGNTVGIKDLTTDRVSEAGAEDDVQWVGENGEMKEMSDRISEWLSDENIEKAKGKTRDEIIEMFGNEPQRIAIVPERFLKYLGDNITDNHVYSGMAYFIDHAVNHHPNISAKKYHYIQEVLNEPDEVKKIKDNDNDSIVFIKHIDRYNAVVIEVEKTEDGKIIWHKSFYNQRKKPYANKGTQLYDVSSGGDVSPIIRTNESAHDGSLSVLDDGAKVVENSDSASDSGKKIAESGENSDISTNAGEELFRDDEENEENEWQEEEDGFVEYKPQTLEEMAMEALMTSVNSNKASQNMRISAMNSIGGEISKLRRAMSKQKEYDISTVRNVSGFAKLMMQNALVEKMSRGKIKRLLGLIEGATGKEDVTQSVNSILDLLLGEVVKQWGEILQKQLKVRSSKVNNKGVEVQGRLDVEGQRMVRTLREAMGMSLEKVDERLIEAVERMESTDDVVAKNAAIDFRALQLAKQYIQEIKESQDEEADIRHELKAHDEERKPGRRTDAERQFVASMDEAIRTNILERIEAYKRLVYALGVKLDESIEKAKDFAEREAERVRHIHHIANSDMQDRDSTIGKRVTPKQQVVNAAQIVMAPMATFDMLAREFGRAFPDGEGYIFDHFVRGGIDVSDKFFKMFKADTDAVNNKIAEIFGLSEDKGVKTVQDLYSMDSKLPKIEVTWNQGTFELTQGQALLVYLAENQTDGRMKLRRMGITEEEAERIVGEIDPRYIALADWVVNDFLPERRKEYNKVHEDLFGAPMAATENYFPLTFIDTRYLPKDGDIGEEDKFEQKPSTITGSVIKRKRNSTPLDLVNNNAFSVLMEHLRDMDHWAAYARYNRDLNTLLNYKLFENRVKNMSTVRFGGGDVLWNNLRNAAQIVAGVYKPKTGIADNFSAKVTKGLAAANIALRFHTALKQLLSSPVFLSQANWGDIAKAIGNMRETWLWAIDNLPTFAERLLGRKAGDPLLRDEDIDVGWAYNRRRLIDQLQRIGMSPNAFVDALTVSVGARAIYQTKKRNYLAMGYSEEQAERRALQDAAISVNESQQSSQGLFVSPMQMDNTDLSRWLSLYRNSPMGFERQFMLGVQGLVDSASEEWRSTAKERLAKKLERDGLSEEDAKVFAERAVKRSIWRSIGRMAMFGHIAPAVWVMGSGLAAYLFYSIGGGDGDDDKKKEYWLQVLSHALSGPLEGLAFGSIFGSLIEFLFSGKNWRDFNIDEGLVRGSVEDLKNKLDSKPYEAVYDLFNMVMSMATGVNPRTVIDMVVATIDAFQGDFSGAREFLLWWGRFMNAPQSVLDNMYLQEIGMTGREARKLTAEELMERYVRYKRRRGAGFLSPFSSEEHDKEVEDKYQKRFDKMLKGYLDDKADEELEEIIAGDDEYLKKFAKQLASERFKARLESTTKEMLDAEYNSEEDLEKKRKVGDMIDKKVSAERGVSVNDPWENKPSSSWSEETQAAYNNYVRYRTAADKDADLQLLIGQKMAEDGKNEVWAQKYKDVREGVREAVKAQDFDKDPAAAMDRIRAERNRLKSFILHD